MAARPRNLFALLENLSRRGDEDKAVALFRAFLAKGLKLPNSVVRKGPLRASVRGPRTPGTGRRDFRVTGLLSPLARDLNIDEVYRYGGEHKLPVNKRPSLESLLPLLRKLKKAGLDTVSYKASGMPLALERLREVPMEEWNLAVNKAKRARRHLFNALLSKEGVKGMPRY